MSNAETNARIAELEAKVAALTEENAALKAKIAETEHEARFAAVEKLFADTGLQFSDAAARPYMELAAQDFEAVARDMRSLKAVSTALFAEQATGEPAPTKPTINAAHIFAARRANSK